MQYEEVKTLLVLAADYGQESRNAIEDVGGWGEGFEMVSEEEGDQRRWSQVITRVIKDDEGKLWQYSYGRGLTEYQEDEWSGAADSLRQVEKHEETKTVVVTSYRPVNTENLNATQS